MFTFSNIYFFKLYSTDDDAGAQAPVDAPTAANDDADTYAPSDAGTGVGTEAATEASADANAYIDAADSDAEASVVANGPNTTSDS